MNKDREYPARMLWKSSRSGWLMVGMCILCTLPMRATFALDPAEALAQVPLEKSTDVKGQPLSILARYPQAGPMMAKYVSQVLASQPSVIDAILSIIPDTSPEQASAIGAGIVRALRSIASKQPELVREIMDKIAGSENIALKTTFFAIGPKKYARPTVLSVESAPASPQIPELGGVSLPVDNIRIGGWKLDKPAPGMQIIPSNKNTDPEKNRVGMIVALVTSDAASNGAVSTSPTN